MGKKVILVDAWRTLFTEDGIFEEMRSMLDEFENKKVVLTNANEEQRVKFGIDKSPYPVFSCDHNPDKVDPEYYNKMFEHLSLDVEDVVYFEHNPEAVASAESVGIKSLHYDKDKKDLDAVRDFLEENLN